MKFNKQSQLVLATTFGLLLATYLTACGTRTIDYVYLASSPKSTTVNGQIQPFAVDSESGALRKAAPAISSGGPMPVAEVASADYRDLYVANQGNSTIAHFGINSDSSLTPKDILTLSSEGNTPVALALNQTKTLLFVLSAYQPGFNSSNISSGALSVYPLTNGTIGSPVPNGVLNYWPIALSGSNSSDIIVPTGLTVLANGINAYVSADDPSADLGYVFSFGIGANGSLSNTQYFDAGVKPSAIASDPTSRFIYVTDFSADALIGYRVENGTDLQFMLTGNAPPSTGDEPSSIAVDPRGFYIYVTNSLDNTVSAFSINLANGIPSKALSTGVNGIAANITDTQPVAITVEPSLGRFVYTANFLGNSSSGFRLNPNTGTLTPNQATPYPTDSSPRAIVSVPHGNYSLQALTN